MTYRVIDELIVGRIASGAIPGVAVVGLDDLLQSRMRELIVTDQEAEASGTSMPQYDCHLRLAVRPSYAAIWRPLEASQRKAPKGRSAYEMLGRTS